MHRKKSTCSRFSSIFENVSSGTTKFSVYRTSMAGRKEILSVAFFSVSFAAAKALSAASFSFSLVMSAGLPARHGPSQKWVWVRQPTKGRTISLVSIAFCFILFSSPFLICNCTDYSNSLLSVLNYNIVQIVHKTIHIFAFQNFLFHFLLPCSFFG